MGNKAITFLGLIAGAGAILVFAGIAQKETGLTITGVLIAGLCIIGIIQENKKG